MVVVAGNTLRETGPDDPVHMLHSVYSPGHFVASFSGCIVMLGDQQRCNAMFDGFALAAEGLAPLPSM